MNNLDLFFQTFLYVILTVTLADATPTTVNQAAIDYSGILSAQQLSSFAECLSSNNVSKVALELLGWSRSESEAVKNVFIAWCETESPNDVDVPDSVAASVRSCFQALNMTAEITTRAHGEYAVKGNWDTEDQLADHFSYFNSAYPDDLSLSDLDRDSMSNISYSSGNQLKTRGNWPDSIIHWTTWRSGVTLLWFASRHMTNKRSEENF